MYPSAPAHYLEVLFHQLPYFLMNEELWYYLFILGMTQHGVEPS